MVSYWHLIQHWENRQYTERNLIVQYINWPSDPNTFMLFDLTVGLSWIKQSKESKLEFAQGALLYLQTVSCRKLACILWLAKWQKSFQLFSLFRWTIWHALSLKTSYTDVLFYFPKMGKLKKIMSYKTNINNKSNFLKHTSACNNAQLSEIMGSF